MPTMESTTAAHYHQDRRLISVQTPLGADVMALLSFNGREEMSCPFEYSLSMVASQDLVEPTALVGRPIDFSVMCHDGSRRPFHGYVSRLTRDAHARGYTATVVPWLWFLTLTSDCRIFQNKTVKQILEQIFKDFGFGDYEMEEVRNSHPAREYCVQYRETSFDFISRLMEEEGIFYFFRHEEDKHVLVLADQGNAYQDSKEDKIEHADGALPRDQVESWVRRFGYRSGKWTYADYNFESPDASLAAEQSTSIELADAKFEMFDYPGSYRDKSTGLLLARIRIEELEADYDTIEASSTYRTLHPGQVFELTCLDPSPDADSSYAITWIEHQASTDTYATSGSSGESYRNRFGCIPKDIDFRPRKVTPKPTINGSQTAVVVGPEGEEIFTDKYGRIKVQFHWDRRGAMDEKSSCWIRVGQLMAGANWGGLFIPRIGQEVIVEFLDGDPDRPIVIGTLYNASNMPPWALPDNKMTSGLATRSSKKGGKETACHFTIDDTKGNELVTLHAEKDALHEVEHDEKVVIGNDQAIEVNANRTAGIKEGDDTLTIDRGNRKTTIAAGKDTLEAKQAVEITVGQSSLKLLPDSIEITVGGSSIKLDASKLELGSMFTTVSGEMSTDVTGLVTTVKADTKLSVEGTVVTIN